MAANRRQSPDPDAWQYVVERAAQREIAALYGSVLEDAIASIESLQYDPEAGEAMRRYNNLYRVYFGNDRYRIIYRLDRRRKRITIIRVRSRKTAYKGMKNP